MRSWWGKRSERAADIRDAERWVKSLGKERIVELMEQVQLPPHLFADPFGNTQDEDKIAEGLYFEAANAMFPNESMQRCKSLGAAMHHQRHLEWVRGIGAEGLAACVAADMGRREAYRADYAARLSAAAAADPTTVENRMAHAQQAFLNTGKYLTNTGRELTPSERKQLGLPSNK